MAPACTFGPIATKKGVSMGGSALTKNKGYYARYEGEFGKIEVGNNESDETIIPGKLINYYGIKSAMEGATAALRTTESTKRILSGHEASKHATTSAADVEKLKILNPVEEAATGLQSP